MVTHGVAGKLNRGGAYSANPSPSSDDRRLGRPTSRGRALSSVYLLWGTPRGRPAHRREPNPQHRLQSALAMRFRVDRIPTCNEETYAMISKFSTVYAGHVDIPDRGQNATPANERRFSNEHLAGVFSKAEAIARLMDETGWDTLWMAEHHFQPEGYEALPTLLMAAVHLCHLTKNLRLGCGFNITPMWH